MSGGSDTFSSAGYNLAGIEMAEVAPEATPSQLQ
jgi:hypothetical protein